MRNRDPAATFSTILAAQADAVGATLVVASHDGRIRDAFTRRYDLEAAA